MQSQWKHVGLDVETTAAIDDITEKMHCIVLIDIDTGEILSFANQPGYTPIRECIPYLEGAERIYIHNGIRFDRPQIAYHLKHLIPWDKIRDTLKIAEMRWTNLKETDPALVLRGKLPSQLVGKHKLEAWGYRLGVYKGDFKPPEETTPKGKKKDEEDDYVDEETIQRWATWTPEMQTYCEQDCRVLRALVLHIRQAGVSPMAVETEQELAEYLAAQERNGWPFDMDAAIELLGTLSARREEIAKELVRVFGSWYEPDKAPFVPKRDDRKKGVTAGCAYTKIKLVTFNPGSRAHIAKRLIKLYAWKPTKFTDGGSPQVDEDVIKSLDQSLPGVALLNEYLMLAKRIGQLSEGKNAWLKLATPNRRLGGKLTGMHHIHHICLQSGAVTHRAVHFRPNAAQTPAVGVPWGKEMRSLWCVPKGWEEVGADASGLELRGLSHYMAPYDGGAYGRTVTEGKNEDGTDIHSINRNALGLEGKKGRADAKTFIYAFLYGSGALNLGQLIGCSAEEVAAFKADKIKFAKARAKLAERQEATDDYTVSCLLKGEQLKSMFLKNTPALRKLITGVKDKAKAEGRLRLPDGRYVPVRHIHAALNSLLQAQGAVVCKRWIVRFNRRLTSEFGPQGWNGKWVAMGWIHDEVQLAVRPEIRDRVEKILVEEIIATGVEFGLRLALDGEAKHGRNWADCH